jgi:hypothetical protein
MTAITNRMKQQRDFNDEVNRKCKTFQQTEASERSIVARATDYCAVIPLIGSLFGLARIIGSAAVAIYYKWHEKNISNSADMLLRAQDEAIRGLNELFPFGGLMLAFEQHGLEKTLTRGAAGNYYCKHDNELYYCNTPLKDKDIQWIHSDQIHSREKSYELLTATFSRVTEFRDTTYVRNQGRVIENDDDTMGPLLTCTYTDEIRDLGPARIGD